MLLVLMVASELIGPKRISPATGQCVSVSICVNDNTLDCSIDQVGRNSNLINCLLRKD